MIQLLKPASYTQFQFQFQVLIFHFKFLFSQENAVWENRLCTVPDIVGSEEWCCWCESIPQQIDNSKPFDPYVVIPSDALHTWVVEGCLRPKDYAQVKAYLCTDSSHPHLVFQEVVTEHAITMNGYEYHIFPFYTIIQGFQWLIPTILSSIISANLVDPLEVHDEVLIRFLICDRLAEFWSATKRNVVSMFTSMQNSAFHLPCDGDAQREHHQCPTLTMSFIEDLPRGAAQQRMVEF